MALYYEPWSYTMNHDLILWTSIFAKTFSLEEPSESYLPKAIYIERLRQKLIETKIAQNVAAMKDHERNML